jgi:CheY-like chemotaxis protein
MSERRGEIKLGAFKTQNARVLLVDDNPVNLTVAEGMLRKYDIAVVTAINGKEGVDKIQQEDFDIAFFDHMMPVMDGVEAAAAIRALGGRYETIPIIALTANALAGVEKMFLDAGMSGFLAKPIIIKELHYILLDFLPSEKVVHVI